MKRSSAVNKKKRGSRYTTKKRTETWVKPGYGYTAYFQRAPAIIPDSMFVCLQYAEVTDSLTSIGQTSDLIYRGNSCFAPSVSGGHQPNGFDQLSALYNRYRVYSSSIDISVIAEGAPTMVFSTVPNFDATSFTSIQDGIEATRAKHTKWVATSGRTSERIKHYATSREIMGLTKREMDDDTTAATISASPVKIWYWHNILHVYTGSISCSVAVKLKYYVEFYGRVALGSS